MTRAGPSTTFSERKRPMVACSGRVQLPPAFQPLAMVRPRSRPSRVASRAAWAMAFTDSGPMNGRPGGTTLSSSTTGRMSQMSNPPIPLALASSSSWVISARSVLPLIQGQRARGRAASGG